MFKSALALLVLLAAFGGFAAAQSGADRDDLEKRYQAKLEEPFAKRVPWVLELEEARRRARVEGKLVLAWFTRSYRPCEPCIAIERGPLESDWWVEVCRGVVPYLNVSARLDEKPDQGMLIEKGGRYLPYCIVMDDQGRKLAELRPVSRLAVEAGLEEARLFRRLRDAAADPKNEAANASLRLFKAIRGDGPLDAERMEELARTESLDAEVKARYRQHETLLAIRETFEATQKVLRESPELDLQERRARLEAALYPHLAKGSSFRIESNPAMFLNYAILATRGAIAAGDAATAKRGLEWIETAERAFVPEIPSRADEGRTEREVFEEKVGLAVIRAAVARLAR
ncbi:MAG: hypothetical protein R3F20_07730 [Planctomycetota bacterium]